MFSLTATRYLLETSRKILSPILDVATKNHLHSTAPLAAWSTSSKPRKWLKYNDKIYPPQLPDEERRPAYVCHMKTNIKYSPWKAWYIACMVRGLSVDEALRQLKFVLKKGAKDIAETIEEAKQLAVEKHHVEYGSNLWIAESFIGKGAVVKGVRRHARGRTGRVQYFHCHYFLRLEEGNPPENYYSKPLEPHEQLENWVKQMRSRRLINSL